MIKMIIVHCYCIFYFLFISFLVNKLVAEIRYFETFSKIMAFEHIAVCIFPHKLTIMSITM